jgi:hypothetical protein
MANEENKIIICEMCDVASHIHCLKPALSKVPSKSWFCDACIKCVSCEKRQQPIASYLDGKWSNKNRLCSECDKCYQQGSYCSICMKAYDENVSDGFVGCDECEKWIHA